VFTCDDEFGVLTDETEDRDRRTFGSSRAKYSPAVIKDPKKIDPLPMFVL